MRLRNGGQEISLLLLLLLLLLLASEAEALCCAVLSPQGLIWRRWPTGPRRRCSWAKCPVWLWTPTTTWSSSTAATTHGGGGKCPPRSPPTPVRHRVVIICDLDCSVSTRAEDSLHSLASNGLGPCSPQMAQGHIIRFGSVLH